MWRTCRRHVISVFQRHMSGCAAPLTTFQDQCALDAWSLQFLLSAPQNQGNIMHVVSKSDDAVTKILQSSSEKEVLLNRLNSLPRDVIQENPYIGNIPDKVREYVVSNIDTRKYSVIIVGGGHAGVEAACAASRQGVKVQLITHNAEQIGEQSCNPSIGGIGKSVLVREVDALDGVLGRACDMASTHKRMQNASKGPAVQSLRVQVDRVQFKKSIQYLLSKEPNIDVFEGEATQQQMQGTENIVKGVWPSRFALHNIDDTMAAFYANVVDQEELPSISGVQLACGVRAECTQVVITTGTFLRSVLHIGSALKVEGGRVTDGSSTHLGRQFEQEMGLRVARVSTGTPPRVLSSTIDWSKVGSVAGEVCTTNMSSMTKNNISIPELPAGLVHTNVKTRQICLDNAVSNTPLLEANDGAGRGPRYCTSIDAKSVRYDRDSHQVWLEREGFGSELVYPAGLSTYLSPPQQESLQRSIHGLEQVSMVRPGYAVEYDYIDPRQVSAAQSVHSVTGLFLAGQILGTTGYEEAAALGIVAGMNAAQTSLNKPSCIFDRGDGYIGVMIDDLTTRGVSEPYRMFTARSEHRQLLRSDNADMRLTHKLIGLVSSERVQQYQQKRSQIQQVRAILSACKQSGGKWNALFKNDLVNIHTNRSALDMLQFDQVVGNMELLLHTAGILEPVQPDVLSQLIVEVKYTPQMRKQIQKIQEMRHSSASIPASFDYTVQSSQKLEELQRLQQVKPTSIQQVRSMEGIRPGTIMKLLHALQKNVNKF